MCYFDMTLIVKGMDNITLSITILLQSPFMARKWRREEREVNAWTEK